MLAKEPVDDHDKEGRFRLRLLALVIADFLLAYLITLLGCRSHPCKGNPPPGVIANITAPGHARLCPEEVAAVDRVLNY